MANADLPFDLFLMSDTLRAVFAKPLETAQLCVQAFAARAGVDHLAGQVTLGYSASREFDAYAFSDGSQHHVVLSAAVPAILLASFFEIMRSTNPFSGDLELRDEGLKPGDFRIPLVLSAPSDLPADLAAAIEEILRQSIPQHRWQRILAVALAELAIVFIFTHEIGHVVCGHTQMLHQARGLRLQEIGMAQGAVPGRVAQAWELQADQAAFGFLWSFAMNTRRQHNRFVRQLMCKSTEPDLDLLGRLCYAISFVFFLLSQGDARVRAPGSHPSPLVRITFLMALAETIMTERCPALAPKVHNCVTRSHEFAEAAWNRLGLEFGTQSYQEHIEDLPDVVLASQRHVRRIEQFLGHHAWVRQACR